MIIMPGYYVKKLSAERLKRVYAIAPPRVQGYIKAEVEFVCSKIKRGDIVLDLGCGYGRIIPDLTHIAQTVIGIDNSLESLQYGRDMLSHIANCHLLCMNAVELSFRDGIFDLTVCIQNGISAFHVNQGELIRESIRVTKPGGIVLFSTYAEKFWPDRLEWFERQSKEGLLGEIDYEKTGNGNIICKDGFTATTVSSAQFGKLMDGFDVDWRLEEVDESSLFCEIVKHR